METRKIQQTGGSTYIVSLPKKWAERAGITTGSQVTLQPQQDGTLNIAAEGSSRNSKKKNIIDVNACFGDELVRLLIAAYLSGPDIIEIRANRIQAEQKKIIRNICYKLIGPEIIEETANSVLIQDLLNPNEVSIKKSVRRMFLISNSMLKDAMQALKTQDHDLALDVIERDDEVDRLFLLISKQFRTVLRGSRLPDTSETTIDEYHDLRLSASSLERIADHAFKIAKIAATLDSPIPADTMALIESSSTTSRDMVEDAIDALYNQNTDLANQVISKVDGTKARINELNASLLDLDSPEAIVALGTVADSIDRIGEYGANIAEFAINLSMAIVQSK
ncbi:phosphate uptake regulator PhoU [Methanococcoides orientis]|uniref:phosphate uptake regulator PhoU n=1 Tax=Methanococcoides orientis TaxID=2822137 RepID=UPI001E4D8567|nr:phosphate uptake regulator PhoU [Methanococcoides orientis]UGV40515.1 phosphate uptake regulator PhoU [Methanococcoides orientis]